MIINSEAEIRPELFNRPALQKLIVMQENIAKMVAFGKYMVSDERRKLFKLNKYTSLPVKEKLSDVHDADIENFERIWQKQHKQ